MTVKIADSAAHHLRDGYDFYEVQEPGAGAYFYRCVMAEIEDLARTGGIHAKHFGRNRVICHKHPFAIYYDLRGDVVAVKAVLDCRRRPSTLRRILKKL